MTDQLEHSRVEDALTAILTSDKFAVAPQMSAFLNYVVHETLAGNANRIKAYTVAVDALGKPDSFDPQNDPSVRVLAKRLRTALDNYYTLYPDTPVIVEMKAGSYVPKFVLRETLQNDAVTDEHTVSLNPTAPMPHDGLESIQGDDRGRTPLEGAPDTKRAATATSNQPDRNVAASPTAVADLAESRPAIAIPSRPSRPAIAIAAAGALLLGLSVNALSPSQDSASLRTAESVAAELVLASTAPARSSQAAHRDTPPMAAAQGVERPAAPVIYVHFPDDSDPLHGQIADTISTVLARFDELDVRRTTRLDSTRHYWPEEYRVIMSTLELESELRIDAQILQADSGSIVHSQTFTIDRHRLTSGDLSDIERFAAQLAQVDGPVFTHYQSGGQLTPRMACFASLQKIIAQARAVDPESANAITDKASSDSQLTELRRCLAELGEDHRHHARALIYQTHAQLAFADLSTRKNSETGIAAAVTAGREAVSLLPFDAGSHAALMMSLVAAGNPEEALDYGERALELNPFDQQVLGPLVALLNDSGATEKAGELQQRIDELGSNWNHTSL